MPFRLSDLYPSGVGLINVIVLPAGTSGNITPTPGTKAWIVDGVAGGGGGGASSNSTNGSTSSIGAGGGAGSSASVYVANPTGTYSYSVGQRGTGGVPSGGLGGPGNAGTATTISGSGLNINCGPGNAGLSFAPLANFSTSKTNGGVPTVSLGTVIRMANGGQSTNGFGFVANGNSFAQGSAGGYSREGVGGPAGAGMNTSVLGSNGENYGGGGAGAVSAGSSANVGGDGAPGRLVTYEFG